MSLLGSGFAFKSLSSSNGSKTKSPSSSLTLCGGSKQERNNSYTKLKAVHKSSNMTVYALHSNGKRSLTSTLSMTRS